MSGRLNCPCAGRAINAASPHRTEALESLAFMLRDFRSDVWPEPLWRLPCLRCPFVLQCFLMLDNDITFLLNEDQLQYLPATVIQSVIHARNSTYFDWSTLD